MSKIPESSASIIFPLGEKVESDNFKGDVWLSMLTPFGTPCPIGNVTFAPGSRNSWHKHAGGQILLVTGGAIIRSGERARRFGWRAFRTKTTINSTKREERA
jgi:hypothetical protein